MFTFLLGIISFIVAGCAAFFSVQGIATLYSGQFWSVVLMASGLETGKLIAASYLHRYWHKTSVLLKTYLTIAVIILMAITSLGVFGFLSSAYQSNSAQVELVDVKQTTLENKKIFIVKEIDQINSRINTLNSARESQEKRLPSMSTTSAKPIYADIAKAGEEIKELRERASNLSADLIKTNEEFVLLETDKKQHTDIGTFKFVANIFNVDTNAVVKWFTLALVFVFDPLAVSLVLAYNNIILKKEKDIDDLLLEREIQDMQLDSLYLEKEIKDTQQENTAKKPNGIKYRDL